jgi:hypothetical protein
MIYSTNINPARANKETLNVIKVLSAGQDITTVYNKAVSIPTPHIDDIRNDMGRTFSNVIVKLHPYSWSEKYAPHTQHRIGHIIHGQTQT